jgi:protein-tyrosine phosphatase
MKADVYWIDGLPAGRLGILPRPRGGDWLDEEILAWRAAGLDLIVSLLTNEEMAEFGLEQEREACRGHGLEFRRLAIPDLGVPSSDSAMVRLVAEVTGALDSGRSVGIHCRQGIGRSSLVAATVLAARGMDPGEAWERIERSRGRPVPDTEEQRTWVEHFSRVHARQSDPQRPPHRHDASPKARA